ncbi:MAG TPA: hypothetical protein VHN37_11860 [Actinomycetota bacterium]|nr:hypothetical protein [Actinomycetota bacterium]
MSKQRSIRTLSVIASAALIVGAFTAGPADAKKKKKKPAGCATFAPIEPNSPSGETAEVLEQPVVKVTDEHTEEAPLVFEYEHGPALWSITQDPIQEDTVFFNIQVDSANPETGLYVFQEWAKQPGSDMDLYVWDGATGEEATHSGSSNVTPVPISEGSNIHGQGTGAWGLESVSGFPVLDCAGFTVESRAFSTAGESMTMSIWLGEQVAPE